MRWTLNTRSSDCLKPRGMFVISVLCHQEELGGSWAEGRAYAMDCKGLCCAGAKVTREKERELYVMYNRHCHFSLWEEMDIDKEDISSVTISSLSMLASLWFFGLIFTQGWRMQ